MRSGPLRATRPLLRIGSCSLDCKWELAPRELKLPKDGVVRLLRDRKSRGGKTVTLVAGLSGTPAALNALASDLKRLCGTGGTVRGEVIEIQGDVRERIKGELERRGYTVKLAGG